MILRPKLFVFSSLLLPRNFRCVLPRELVHQSIGSFALTYKWISGSICLPNLLSDRVFECKLCHIKAFSRFRKPYWNARRVQTCHPPQSPVCPHSSLSSTPPSLESLPHQSFLNEIPYFKIWGKKNEMLNESWFLRLRHKNANNLLASFFSCSRHEFLGC